MTPRDAFLCPLPCCLQASQCWLQGLLPALKTPVTEVEGQSGYHLHVLSSTDQVAPITFKLFLWLGRDSLPTYYF